MKIGVVGNGMIVGMFLHDVALVDHTDVVSLCVRPHSLEKGKKIAEEHHIPLVETDYDAFLKNPEIETVYVGIANLVHYEYAKKALEHKKHVLCEKPMTLEMKKTKELYRIAKENKVVLYEAIKTAYSPAFIRLIALAKSGIIGEIKDIDATFTKLIEDNSLREFDKEQAGGSVTELATYPLIVILKLLGINYNDIDFFSYNGKQSVDLYTKIILKYNTAIATANVGLGVKKEGELIIAGTKGYIYVPAPWWKTEYFEVRFEDASKNERYFYKFEGDGLRYEVSEFLKSIVNNEENICLREEESIIISEIIGIVIGVSGFIVYDKVLVNDNDPIKENYKDNDSVIVEDVDKIEKETTTKLGLSSTLVISLSNVFHKKFVDTGVSVYDNYFYNQNKTNIANAPDKLKMVMTFRSLGNANYISVADFEVAYKSIFGSDAKVPSITRIDDCLSDYELVTDYYQHPDMGGCGGTTASRVFSKLVDAKLIKKGDDETIVISEAVAFATMSDNGEHEELYKDVKHTEFVENYSFNNNENPLDFNSSKYAQFDYTFVKDEAGIYVFTSVERVK